MNQVKFWIWKYILTLKSRTWYCILKQREYFRVVYLCLCLYLCRCCLILFVAGPRPGCEGALVEGRNWSKNIIWCYMPAWDSSRTPILNLGSVMNDTVCIWVNNICSITIALELVSFELTWKCLLSELLWIHYQYRSYEFIIIGPFHAMIFSFIGLWIH